MQVFKKHDKDGNGVLDEKEFWAVLSSKTCNLFITKFRDFICIFICVYLIYVFNRSLFIK